MQSDLQAFGQLIVILMKHTDFEDVHSKKSEKFSDLVQNCSFNLKNWSQVLDHTLFKIEISRP